MFLHRVLVSVVANISQVLVFSLSVIGNDRNADYFQAFCINMSMLSVLSGCLLLNTNILKDKYQQPQYILNICISLSHRLHKTKFPAVLFC